VVTGVPADVARDGSVAPVVVADMWDGSRWTRGPETGQVGNSAWFWTGTQMVDPEPGVEDGGDTNGWGRAYPQGGIIDPMSGSWSRLPSSFVEDAGGLSLNAVGGRWVATYGQVYDTETGAVTTLPALDGAPHVGMTGAWADGQLLAFGGDGGDESVLTNHAWLYTPPTS
jgi:hypothetical protein